MQEKKGLSEGRLKGERLFFYRKKKNIRSEAVDQRNLHLEGLEQVLDAVEKRHPEGPEKKKRGDAYCASNDQSKRKEEGGKGRRSRKRVSLERKSLSKKEEEARSVGGRIAYKKEKGPSQPDPEDLF